MSYLGNRFATGVHGITSNPFGAGMWTVQFDPQILRLPQDVEIYHIFLSGPAPSTARMYIGTAPYSNIARGDINDWDPQQPAFVRRGETVFFYWSVAGNPAPMVILYPRTPRLG